VASARSLREQVREELRQEIVELARARLAVCGAGNLSLRGIARDLGMVSSAVYRYFASRDDLLTALVVDGYNAIGEAVEKADAAVPCDDYSGRWLAVCRAVRDWAVTHPHEYALVYGSPVPGYRAPPGTVRPAARDKIVYGSIISDAYGAGALRPPDLAPAAQAAFAADARRMREVALPGVPDGAVVGALTAWAGLFGMINLELFGHFANTIEDRVTLFDQSMTQLGRLAGLPASP
jgi:AcrR family transcriptional regulator